MLQRDRISQKCQEYVRGPHPEGPEAFISKYLLDISFLEGVVKEVVSFLQRIQLQVPPPGVGQVPPPVVDPALAPGVEQVPLPVVDPVVDPAPAPGVEQVPPINTSNRLNGTEEIPLSNIPDLERGR